jgi:hypothetical protein
LRSVCPLPEACRWLISRRLIFAPLPDRPCVEVLPIPHPFSCRLRGDIDPAHGPTFLMFRQECRKGNPSITPWKCPVPPEGRERGEAGRTGFDTRSRQSRAGRGSSRIHAGIGLLAAPPAFPRAGSASVLRLPGFGPAPAAWFAQRRSPLLQVRSACASSPPPVDSDGGGSYDPDGRGSARKNAVGDVMRRRRPQRGAKGGVRGPEAVRKMSPLARQAETGKMPAEPEIRSRPMTAMIGPSAGDRRQDRKEGGLVCRVTKAWPPGRRWKRS